MVVLQRGAVQSCAVQCMYVYTSGRCAEAVGVLRTVFPCKSVGGWLFGFIPSRHVGNAQRSVCCLMLTKRHPALLCQSGTFWYRRASHSNKTLALSQTPQATTDTHPGFKGSNGQSSKWQQNTPSRAQSTLPTHVAHILSHTHTAAVS